MKNSKEMQAAHLPNPGRMAAVTAVMLALLLSGCISGNRYMGIDLSAADAAQAEAVKADASMPELLEKAMQQHCQFVELYPRLLSYRIEAGAPARLLNPQDNQPGPNRPIQWSNDQTELAKESRSCQQIYQRVIAAHNIMVAARSSGISTVPGQHYLQMPLVELARRAKFGDKQAQLALGVRFEEARGMPRDMGKAKALYQLAAEDTEPTQTLFIPTDKGVQARTVHSGLERIKGLDEASTYLQTLDKTRYLEGGEHVERAQMALSGLPDNWLCENEPEAIRKTFAIPPERCTSRSYYIYVDDGKQRIVHDVAASAEGQLVTMALAEMNKQPGTPGRHDVYNSEYDARLDYSHYSFSGYRTFILGSIKVISIIDYQSRLPDMRRANEILQQAASLSGDADRRAEALVLYRQLAFPQDPQQLKHPMAFLYYCDLAGKMGVAIEAECENRERLARVELMTRMVVRSQSCLRDSGLYSSDYRGSGEYVEQSREPFIPMLERAYMQPFVRYLDEHDMSRFKDKVDASKVILPCLLVPDLADQDRPLDARAIRQIWALDSAMESYGTPQQGQAQMVMVDLLLEKIPYFRLTRTIFDQVGHDIFRDEIAKYVDSHDHDRYTGVGCLLCEFCNDIDPINVKRRYVEAAFTSLPAHLFEATGKICAFKKKIVIKDERGSQ